MTRLRPGPLQAGLGLTAAGLLAAAASVVLLRTALAVPAVPDAPAVTAPAPPAPAAASDPDASAP